MAARKNLFPKFGDRPRSERITVRIPKDQKVSLDRRSRGKKSLSEVVVETLDAGLAAGATAKPKTGAFE